MSQEGAILGFASQMLLEMVDIGMLLIGGQGCVVCRGTSVDGDVFVMRTSASRQVV